MQIPSERSNIQNTIRREINEYGSTRDTIATTYAVCLLQPDEVDFRVVNHAIIDRWSLYTLDYIKRKAWNMV